MNQAVSNLGVALMKSLAHVPLRLLRALGWVLGAVLFGLVRSRRRVVMANLQVCFPDLSASQRRDLAWQTFIHFAQAWLDRSWLWHAPADVVRQRLLLTGAVDELTQPIEQTPLVIFAPHFMGLDAAWTALTQQVPRRINTIYFPQVNPVVDRWIMAGRQRFGQGQLVQRGEGAQTLVARLRAGEPLYLLPDLNYEPAESLFVPFFGHVAATVPSLSRFAKLGRAKVVPVLSKLTPKGYTIEVLPAWADFPTQDIEADTALMNQRLETYIRTMPSQYYWVHRRFKDLPAGVPAVYRK
jgi:KDO2-lipid IV(A) lauroyltransferase